MSKKENEIAKKREKFLGVCKVCGNPMKFIEGTNVVVCSNGICPGWKSKRSSGDDESEFESSRVVSRLLNPKQAGYAAYLFGDKA